jgi:hypothetical protein
MSCQVLLYHDGRKRYFLRCCWRAGRSGGLPASSWELSAATVFVTTGIFGFVSASRRRVLLCIPSALASRPPDQDRERRGSGSPMAPICLPIPEHATQTGTNSAPISRFRPIYGQQYPNDSPLAPQNPPRPHDPMPTKKSAQKITDHPSTKTKQTISPPRTES